VLVASSGCVVKRPAAGTWKGIIEERRPLGVKFEVEEDADGKLAGKTYFQDNGTDYQLADTFTGRRDGVSVSWTSEGEVVVMGKFENEKYERIVGTIEFPAQEGFPAHKGVLIVTR
jgi:hypothetical protein